MASLLNLFSDLPPYQYTPIPATSRTFRLVQLLPPEPCLIPGLLQPTVRISLIECDSSSSSSNNPVEYDALSYAWDVPPNSTAGPNRRIIVEGHDGTRFSLSIHRPLEVALLQFSAGHEFDNRQHLPLFIDQLCINQRDDAEKAQQVLLMQAIYARCRRAVVWLGPGSPSSEAWFAYVHEICADGTLPRLMSPRRVGSIMRIHDAVMDPSVTTVLTDAQDIQDREALLALTRRWAPAYPVAAYLHLLRRRWFRRLWTIQEACLAPAVLLVCGDARLCLDCFRAGMFFYNVQNGYWLRHHTANPSKEEMALRSAVFDATSGFTRIYQERKRIHEPGRQRAPLHELVITYSVVSDAAWKVGASLGQDRIYGLYGLAADDDPVKAQLGIYYDKENKNAAVVKAFTEAAGLFLRQGHLDVLLLNQTPKQTPGLPSWVPDWTMAVVLPAAWASLHQPAFAAGGEAAHVDSVTSSKISVQGVLLGSVAAVGTCTYTTQKHTVSTFLEQIDYAAAKHMFDEIDAFIASALPLSSSSDYALTQTRLRVYDAGLSARHLPLPRLLALQTSIALLGSRLLRAAATARSYSLFNIYATVGITPWYVDYYRPTAILRHLARGPAPLGKTLVLAVAGILEDVLGLCLASARVWLATTRIRLRRRFGTVVALHDASSDAHLRSVGLDPEVVKGEDMLAFLTNLQRNVGRRVYRTEGGQVGLGPGMMAAGDAVVVMRGVSTPMMLRRVQAREEWTVVGEAYCDGVMEGEALGMKEREFVLV